MLASPDRRKVKTSQPRRMPLRMDRSLKSLWVISLLRMDRKSRSLRVRSLPNLLLKSLERRKVKTSQPKRRPPRMERSLKSLWEIDLLRVMERTSRNLAEIDLPRVMERSLKSLWVRNQPRVMDRSLKSQWVRSQLNLSLTSLEIRMVRNLHLKKDSKSANPREISQLLKMDKRNRSLKEINPR